MHECAVCQSENLKFFLIAGLRRAFCQVCAHTHRVDIEPFDYKNVAMGRSGTSAARLKSQVEFIKSANHQFSDVLEIGSADGALARAMRRQFTFDRYDGIEFSPAATEAKKVMDKVFDEPLIDLVSSGKIKNDSYDLVITSHCLEHMMDVRGEVRAIREVLRPSGFVFVEVPNGSGNIHLPFDDNRAHLHFFCVNSIVRLMDDFNFVVTAATTGAWYDARYSDSIRIAASANYEAMNETSPTSETAKSSSNENLEILHSRQSKSLAAHPLLNGVDNVVVWGAGRMTEELLAHFFDPARIAFFVDSDSKKHGQSCLGRAIKSTQSLNELENPCVLINSLEFEDVIREQIKNQFPGKNMKVIGVGELIS